jgi:predicted ribosomally synthesized peptide with nif11-like leader
MAPSNAKDLIKKMGSDESFRQSLQAAGSKEARKAILAKNGFSGVSVDDVRAVAKAEGTELTDDQLQSVAGGMMKAPARGAGLTSPVEWASVAVAAASLLV